MTARLRVRRDRSRLGRAFRRARKEDSVRQWEVGYPALSPDGKTFAMVRRSPAARIVLIQNLPALVRRLQGERTNLSP